jgi:hypothetical protein
MVPLQVDDKQFVEDDNKNVPNIVVFYQALAIPNIQLRMVATLKDLLVPTTIS